MLGNGAAKVLIGKAIGVGLYLFTQNLRGLGGALKRTMKNPRGQTGVAHVFVRLGFLQDQDAQPQLTGPDGADHACNASAHNGQVIDFFCRMH